MFNFLWATDNLQEEVKKWTTTCFKDLVHIQLLPGICAYRFFEEAIELFQALSMTREDAHRLVDYVFDREKGTIEQEVGGVVISLMKICNANQIEFTVAAAKELEKNYGRMDKIYNRQKEKLFPLGMDNPYITNVTVEFVNSTSPSDKMH